MKFSGIRTIKKLTVVEILFITIANYCYQCYLCYCTSMLNTYLQISM